MTIQMIDHNTFQQVRGAHTMTLSRKGPCWEMMTSNPSTRAWNRMPSFKTFDSLQDVEAHYKSWRGVSKLVQDHSSTQAIATRLAEKAGCTHSS